MLTPCRRVLVEKCPFYYPFGNNTSVRNVLQDCQLVGDNIKVQKYSLVLLFLVVFPKLFFFLIYAVGPFPGKW